MVESKKSSLASAFEADLTHREKGSWREKAKREDGRIIWDRHPISFYSRQRDQGELRRSTARVQPGVPLEFEAGRGSRTGNPRSGRPLLSQEQTSGFQPLPGIDIFCSGRLPGRGWGRPCTVMLAFIGSAEPLETPWRRSWLLRGRRASPSCASRGSGGRRSPAHSGGPDPPGSLSSRPGRDSEASSVCRGDEKGPDVPQIPARAQVGPAARAAGDAKRRGNGRAGSLELAVASAPPLQPIAPR